MQAQMYHARISPVIVSFRSVSSRVIKTPSIKFISITECCARNLECLRVSINPIAYKIASGASTDSNPSGKAWHKSQATGTVLLSSNISLERSGRERWNPSRNRTKFSLKWPSALVHNVNWIRSRRSMSSYQRKNSPLEAVSLEVIIFPTFLVTTSEMKGDIPVNAGRWTR